MPATKKTVKAKARTNGRKAPASSPLPTTYTVNFELNGKPVSAQVNGKQNLLEVLREQLYTTGPKFGCEQGNCGACTVLLDGEPVSSCLVLAATLEGRKVMTVEGLGTPDNLHPLQKAFYDHYSAQCGFCTSGMLVSAYALLQKNPQPNREQVVQAISGNLCRCTGYVKIIDAILDVAQSNGKEKVR